MDEYVLKFVSLMVKVGNDNVGTRFPYLYTIADRYKTGIMRLFMEDTIGHNILQVIRLVV